MGPTRHERKHMLPKYAALKPIAVCNDGVGTYLISRCSLCRNFTNYTTVNTEDAKDRTSTLRLGSAHIRYAVQLRMRPIELCAFKQAEPDAEEI